jgi:hypothetical protein
LCFVEFFCYYYYYLLFLVGFEVLEGKTGRGGRIHSSASLMESRWVIWILIGPVLKYERVGRGGA